MDNILVYGFRVVYTHTQLCTHLPPPPPPPPGIVLYNLVYSLNNKWNHHFLGKRAGSPGRAGGGAEAFTAGEVGRGFLQERQGCWNGTAPAFLLPTHISKSCVWLGCVPVHHGIQPTHFEMVGFEAPSNSKMLGFWDLPLTLWPLATRTVTGLNCWSEDVLFNFPPRPWPEGSTFNQDGSTVTISTE